MSNIKTVLRRAKRVLKTIDKTAENNNNTIIVTDKPYNKPLDGELVVILYNEHDD